MKKQKDDDGPDIRFFKARGDLDSPDTLLSGDYIGAFNTRSYVAGSTSDYVNSGFLGWNAGTNPSLGESVFNIKTNVGGSNAVRFKIETSGRITINNGSNAITFPASDGSYGQVLKTDGSGDLFWGTSDALGTSSDGQFLQNSGDTIVGTELNMFTSITVDSQQIVATSANDRLI